MKPAPIFLLRGRPEAGGQLSRLVASLRFDLRPADPAAYAPVALTLGLIAALASLAPSLRALRIQPSVALRYEWAAGGAGPECEKARIRGISLAGAGSEQLSVTMNGAIAVLSLSVLAGILGLLPPCRGQAPGTPGLVGYWKLNGNPEDSSGMGNSGALRFRSSPYTAFPPARLGPGLDSSAGAYVEVPDSPSVSALGSLTIEAWIYLNNYPPTPSWGQTGGGPIAVKWGPSLDADDEFRLHVMHYKRVLATVSGSRGYLNVESSVDIPLQTWTHLAFVQDSVNGRCMLLINGQIDRLVSTNVVGDRDTSMPVHIGYVWHDSGGPLSFPGLIDEVRLWKRALSVEEIQGLNCLGADRILFSGRCWAVRNQTDAADEPGPIYWLPQNVAVEQGKLRLQLTRQGGNWYGAQVQSVDKLKYGTYAFDVESRLNFSHPNLVLGLFTFSDLDLPAPGSPPTKCRPNEIDFEFTRWGAGGDWFWQLLGKPAFRHLTVAPNCGLPRQGALTLPLFYPGAGTTRSLHKFTWTPTYVHFVTQKAGEPAQKVEVCMSPTRAACPANALWLWISRVPVANDLHKAILNLWMFKPQSAPDMGDTPYSVWINGFEHQPLN